MSIIQSTAKSGATSFYDYPIEQSLRFDGSSYLQRTSSSGDNQTLTISLWAKVSRLDAANALIYTYYVGSNGRYNILRFNSANKLNSWTNTYNTTSSSTQQIVTDSLYRDTNAWFHIVNKIDTTAASGSRNLIYVNGVEQSTSGDYPSSGQSLFWNTIDATVRIGGTVSGGEFSGYLANIQFIDGQALDPYFFGESKNGVWIPYNAFSTAGSGTATASDGDTATDSYGTNGFHLTFEDGIETLSVNSSNVSAFRDKSHNTNHWKIN